VDLCRRLRHAGWELAWVPTAVVTHHGGASTRQVAAMMFLRLYAAKIMYFRKHNGRAAVWQYKAILAAASAIRLAAAPVACFEPPKARTRHLSLAGHYSRLLRALPDL
jgi:GT2 family glycosyltransferase